MQWNLRMVAAQHGVWKASDLRRMLAEQGLVISAGKMSNLWSGKPISIRLDDLDVICGVLGCSPADLLLPDELEPAQAPEPAQRRAAASPRPTRRTGRRTPPPV
ncbi:helix-turn-helix domain-containing protein [Leekyejoonella antrihumi]|uniref:Helix-turn-helix transcriptional regulator n=1 Tax=Leekyejoonella antrihumi TaxID=1660198 RepID=A0A563DQU9_9MICO|nr:helix-turn-helix transcriptional regulator [Leekyejoonella antrihumi]TWP32074.1 helix-turn-helix transcriptional regulator [Leekyejoonella antrihumi]